MILTNCWREADGTYTTYRLDPPAESPKGRIAKRMQRKFARDYYRKPFVPQNKLQGWVQTLSTAQGAGAQLSNSVTPTSILPAQAKYTFPTNFLDPVGKALRVTMCGQVSNVVTTPGTLTLDLRLGAVVAFNGGAMQMSTTAHTTLPIWWQVLLTVRTVGSGTAATLIGQSVAMGQMMSATAVADSTTSHGVLLAPNTTPAAGTGYDSTTTEQLDCFATFSVSTSPTNITLQQFVLEDLNYLPG